MPFSTKDYRQLQRAGASKRITNGCSYVPHCSSFGRRTIDDTATSAGGNVPAVKVVQTESVLLLSRFHPRPIGLVPIRLLYNSATIRSRLHLVPKDFDFLLVSPLLSQHGPAVNGAEVRSECTKAALFNQSYSFLCNRVTES